MQRKLLGAGCLGWLVVVSSIPAQSPSAGSDMDRIFEKHIFENNEARLPYRLMKPEGFSAGTATKFPLVIFLHGIGERGTDNAKQLRNGVEEFAKEENRRRYPCFLVVPQCPPDQLWVNVNPPGTRSNLTLADQPTQPLAMVLDLIDRLCRELPVDRQRIYLTGLSQGGYGTWDFICRRPELFAAAIPVCGGGDPGQASKLVKLPIWAFHGDADSVIPPERSRDMVAAIEKAGGKPKYTEYPGVGHDSWTPTYRNAEVLEWLFKQRRGD
ncbi:MAG: dienelactone hydrolase family protein [Gemmataceae bacterium]|nr:dienelactone hydrolase family protein [Gemmataceae bacterium]